MNQDLKKLKKDIQNQKYNLFEQERQNNIQKCIQKRKEMIDNANKPKDYNIENNKSEGKKIEDKKHLYNSADRTKKISDKNGQNIITEKNRRILMTDDSYIMQNSFGNNSLITKNDLNKVTCLRKEKTRLEKQAEDKDEYLMRILKSEIIREKKIRKVKDKINKKEEQLKKFLKDKNDGIKYIENERYQDNQYKYERKQLYDKILSNYELKINTVKKSNDKNSHINKDKLEELRGQIKDYERKNEEYKKKINEMFDLKDSEDNKQLMEIKKLGPSNSTLGQKRLIDLEEKFEMERYRRENALMSHMNQVQNKINGFLEKNEEKEKKIKKAIEKIEKKREEKRIIQSMHYDDIRENVKNKQKKLEKERKKKLESLEKKDLKNFAIRQEKIKIYEEKKKMNQLNYEEREAMKAKLKEILKNKKNLDKIEENEDFLHDLLNN